MILPDIRRYLQERFNAVIETSDYRGRSFSDFYPARNPWGTGWVVNGRGAGKYTYGGALVMVCATPAKIRNRWGQPGFKTKREAASLAKIMNDCVAP